MSGRVYTLCLLGALVSGIGLTGILVDAQARWDRAAAAEGQRHDYQQLRAAYDALLAQHATLTEERHRLAYWLDQSCLGGWR